MTVAVRVVPRSPHVRVDPPRDGRLIVRVNPAPADGAANRAVRKTLAGLFGVAPSRVRILRGETARDKLVSLEGVTASDAERIVKGLGA